jgi:hypothetical protein
MQQNIRKGRRLGSLAAPSLAAALANTPAYAQVVTGYIGNAYDFGFLSTPNVGLGTGTGTGHSVIIGHAEAGVILATTPEPPLRPDGRLRHSRSRSVAPPSAKREHRFQKGRGQVRDFPTLYTGSPTNTPPPSWSRSYPSP